MYKILLIEEDFIVQQISNVAFFITTGYENTFSTEAVKPDYTLPNTSLLFGDLPVDDVLRLPCESFVPAKYHHRCIDQTTLDNYR